MNNVAFVVALMALAKAGAVAVRAETIGAGGAATDQGTWPAHKSASALAAAVAAGLAGGATIARLTVTWADGRVTQETVQV